MAKIFRLHALPAEYGDALWIEYGEEASPKRILVDAGTPGTFKRLKPLLLPLAKQNQPAFELLVVTHIDADHIGGVVKILEDAKLRHMFRDVWFNGRAHLDVKTELEPFGAAQGEALTTAILDNGLPWNGMFGGKSIYLHDDGKPPVKTLPGGLTITILSPTARSLANLIPKWDAEVIKAGLVKEIRPPTEKQIEGFEQFGAIDVETLAATHTKEDSAEANGSSIGMLLEFDGKRMLLGADCHPSVLLAGVKRLKDVLPVEIFKVPHHGSKGNVTEQLIAAMPAQCYVFSTNGKRFSHPDQEAVARVILATKGQGRDVVFNYRSGFNKAWDDQALMQEYGYKVHYGNEMGIVVPLA